MPVKFEWTNIEAFAADHFGAPRPRLLHSGVNGRFWIFDIGCDVGEGVVEYYQLPAGFNVLVIDCQLEQKREITVNDGGGIRLNFALALDVIMSPAGHEATHAATQSWRVVNAGNQADITEHLAPQTRHCWMTIHTAPEWLARLTGQTIAIDGANWLANGAYFTHCLDWDDDIWSQARERIRATNARDRADRST